MKTQSANHQKKNKRLLISKAIIISQVYGNWRISF